MIGLIVRYEGILKYRCILAIYDDTINKDSISNLLYLNSYSPLAYFSQHASMPLIIQYAWRKVHHNMQSCIIKSHLDMQMCIRIYILLWYLHYTIIKHYKSYLFSSLLLILLLQIFMFHTTNSNRIYCETFLQQRAWDRPVKQSVYKRKKCAD